MQRIPRTKNKKRRFFVIFSFSFLIVAGISFFIWRAVAARDTPLVLFSAFGNESALKQDNGRVNFLLLGIDRRSLLTSTERGELTDTIMVASYDIKSKEVSVVSLPRDMWVPYLSGGYGKINSAYATGLYWLSSQKAVEYSLGEHQGATYAAKTLERVLGIPIHYYAVIGFDSFISAVDILGGIDVDVERSFDDFMYPIPGRENIEPEELRYEHLHFEAGLSHFDGETALKFARSRKALGSEGTDFARSARQQKVVEAVRSKLLSLETLTNLSRIKSLYNEFYDSLETNANLSEAITFAGLFPQISKVSYFVLNGPSSSDPQLLYDSMLDLSDDVQAYVLLPTGGDYSKVQDFFANIFSIE